MQPTSATCSVSACPFAAAVVAASLAKSAGKSPDQERRERIAKRRAEDIDEAARKVKAVLSYGADGPPWARGREKARADMVATADALRERWGDDSVNEMRARVNPKAQTDPRFGGDSLEPVVGTPNMKTINERK